MMYHFSLLLSLSLSLFYFHQVDVLTASPIKPKRFRYFINVNLSDYVSKGNQSRNEIMVELQPERVPNDYGEKLEMRLNTLEAGKKNNSLDTIVSDIKAVLDPSGVCKSLDFVRFDTK